MPAGHLHRRMLGGSPPILQYLQSLYSGVHIYPLNDSLFTAGAAPFNELGDVTQSDNGADGIPSGLTVSSQLGSSIATTNTTGAANIGTGDGLQLGGYNHAGDTPTDGRTFGVFIKWKRHTTSPGVDNQVYVWFKETGTNGIIWAFTQGRYDTTPYNDETYACQYYPGGSIEGTVGLANVGVSTWDNGVLYVLTSNYFAGVPTYQHRLTGNGTLITNYNSATQKVLYRSNEFYVQFGNQGSFDAFAQVQYAFYMHDYVMSDAEIQAAVNNYQVIA